MADEKAKKNFDVNALSKEDKEYFDFFKKRIVQLQESRKKQYGLNIEKIWADADKDYMPHRLGTKGKKIIATDEDKGWRGALVTVGTSDWQSDISQANVYVKINIALGILVDRNPSGVFAAGASKYEATTEIMKQLYQRSWEVANSKQQLKLFIYNLSKYGWACGRTYPLYLSRKVKNIVSYDPENPDKTEYEEKEVVEYNDIMRENLDPWNVWIDDMARPNNTFSLRDWAWRKVYSMESFEEEFGKYKNFKYVQAGGIITDKIQGLKSPEKKLKEKDLVEVYFYENRIKDLFMVVANGVPVIIEPLPISDNRGNKKLSLWQAYWTLRHAECPYGIGVYESIRYDQAFLDRVRNMTVDQLMLSIYKMFFYQGTQSLTETGDIVIAPGVGKQTLDPKNIQFLEVPGPGQDAWAGLEMFRKNLDEASGITDPLMGNITGKTAFEIAQAKESALKRMKVPLDNITDMLDTEAYITVSLIQLLYSIPEVHKITDERLINDYLKEIQSDPSLYERDEQGNFTAKVYPEFPLNLQEDEKGNVIESQKTRFFRVKPKFLKWEGIINVKAQSVLTPSTQLDRALDMEMYQVIIPLLTNPPELYGKIAKNIIKRYDKDPRDILPDNWLAEPQQGQQQQNTTDLFVPAQGQQQGQQQAQPQQPQGAGAQQTPSMVQGLMSKFMKPFKK